MHYNIGTYANQCSAKNILSSGRNEGPEEYSGIHFPHFHDPNDSTSFSYSQSSGYHHFLFVFFLRAEAFIPKPLDQALIFMPIFVPSLYSFPHPYTEFMTGMQ